MARGRVRRAVEARLRHRDAFHRAKALLPRGAEVDAGVCQHRHLQIAAEEKNIRTNPAARVTDVLKRVFGQ